MTQFRKSNSGQVLLITLLVLAVASTFILSIIGRTTTDVALSNQIALSSQAFSAAEAGIEQVLKTGIGSGLVTLSPGVTFNAVTANIGGAAGVYIFPRKTNPGSTDTIWLVNHNPDGSLNETQVFNFSSMDICWSNNTTTPAVLVSLIYKRAGAYLIARGAYDPVLFRAQTSNFATPTATSGGCGAGTGTDYKQTISTNSFVPPINLDTDTLIALRITPVYASTQLGLNTGPTVLPLQGIRIDSEGTAGSGVSRKVVVYQQYRVPPPIFDYVIYSQANFSQ